MAQSASSATGQSKQNPLGIIVKAPPPKQYLCAHICRCKSGSKIVDSLGRHLKQRCVTRGVSHDFEKNIQNVYLGEVGYDMTKTPPAPLMSADQPSRPSRFPLGAAMREGLRTVSKDELERAGGSAFRIPDIIKIATPGQAPVQSNIDRVIEIKFAGDSWRDGQRESYLIIAGGEDKLLLLTESECGCQAPEGERAPAPAPAFAPMPSPAVRSRDYSPMPSDLGLQPSRSLSDQLIANAPLINGLVLVGVVALFIFNPAVGGAVLLLTAANR